MALLDALKGIPFAKCSLKFVLFSLRSRSLFAAKFGSKREVQQTVGRRVYVLRNPLQNSDRKAQRTNEHIGRECSSPVCQQHPAWIPSQSSYLLSSSSSPSSSSSASRNEALERPVLVCASVVFAAFLTSPMRACIIEH